MSIRCLGGFGLALAFLVVSGCRHGGRTSLTGGQVAPNSRLATVAAAAVIAPPPDPSPIAQIPARLRPRLLETEASSQLSGMAFSPDGKRLATVSFESAQIWDARTLRLIQTLTGAEYDGDPVFSHDGAALFIGTTRNADGCRDYQWRNIATGKILHVWKDRELSTDGSCLFREEPPPSDAADRSDGAPVPGKITLYVPRTNRVIGRLRLPVGFKHDYALSPDRRAVAVSNEEQWRDGVVRLYDLRTGQCIQTLSDPRGELADGDGVCGPMDFSPDGRLLITLGEDPNFHVGHNPEAPGQAVSEAAVWRALPLKLWDLRTGKLLRMWPGQYMRSTPRFLHGAHRIASLGAERLDVWNVATGKRVYSFRLNDMPYGGAWTLAPDHRTLACLGVKSVMLLTLPAPLETIASGATAIAARPSPISSLSQSVADQRGASMPSLSVHIREPDAAAAAGRKR